MQSSMLCASDRFRCVRRPVRWLLPFCAALCFPSAWGAEPVQPVGAGQAFAERQALVVVTVWETTQRNPRIAVHYETELRDAMDDLGVRARFVSLEEATRNSFAGRIVVLRMSEYAGDSRRKAPSMPASALAWTHASGGDVTPFGIVDLSALRSFVRIRPFSLALEQEALLFGRAIARVAAHEIYHMITRTMEHSPHGLMQPSLSVTDLTGECRPAWREGNRLMAQSAFPSARTDEVLAAVQRREQQ